MEHHACNPLVHEHGDVVAVLAASSFIPWPTLMAIVIAIFSRWLFLSEDLELRVIATKHAPAFAHQVQSAYAAVPGHGDDVP